MATTHHFNDDSDYSGGGRWADDYGRTICTWFWNAETREISVRCGSVGRRRDLSDFNPGWLTDDELRKRLPPVALDIAEQLKSEREQTS